MKNRFEEDFEAQYEAGKCRGWEDLTCRMDLYTKATDRLFANENTKKSHENSKAYLYYKTFFSVPRDHLTLIDLPTSPSDLSGGDQLPVCSLASLFAGRMRPAVLIFC